MSIPFAQGRFEALPATPRLLHPWFDLAVHTVMVETPALGATAVRYRRLGSGPPLLLVHGLMTTGYSWRYVIEELSRYFTVYAPDLVGAGETPSPDRPLPAAAMADWLAALIAALAIEGCPVVGNSMGGWLSMQLALRHPKRVARLCVLHAPGLPEARLWALWLATRLPGALAILGALVRRDPRRWAHRNVHYYDESLKSMEEAREYGDVLGTDAGLRGFLAQLRDMMDVRAMVAFARELRRLRAGGRPFPVPLQLIYVRRDPMVPPRIGTRLAALIPSADFVRLDEGSHFLHVDRPALFLRHALPFLQELAAERANR